MRIILSRKGFDSASGGAPSPILPDGTLVSLPIPEHGGRAYADIRTPDGTAYAELMRQLGIRVPPTGAHLDPDLDPAAVPRQPGWRPLFGQVAAAQGHLANAGVGPGDVFLFFGLFRHTRWRGRSLAWAPDPPQHVVWGYLQVGARWTDAACRRAPAWAADHPHVRSPNRPKNTVYVAAPRLSLDPELAGAGRLAWHAGAVLTASGSRCSIWKLPACVWPADLPPDLSYHGDLRRWTRLADGELLLRSVGRGQEFVMHATPDRQQWALGLLRAGQPGPRPKPA